MKVPSWRVWVPTGVAGGALTALLVMLVPSAGPAAAAPPAAPPAAAQSSNACTAPLVPAPAGSTDYFLKLDGIQGGSTDAKHRDEISISSFVWGINLDRNACSGITAGGSGGGTGKVHLSDIQFVKVIDKSSPKLAQAVATGKHISSAVLTARKAGGKAQQDFLVITLTQVSITSYSISASTGSVPQDTFDVSYAQIKYQFFPQRPDGGLESPITVCFNLAAGKNC